MIMFVASEACGVDLDGLNLLAMSRTILDV